MIASEKPSPTDWESEIPDAPPVSPNISNQGSVVDEPPAGSDEGFTEKNLIVKQTAADMQHNRGLRERYADKAHQLASGCICGWMVMLGCQGVIKAVTGIEMWSDKVIIAATTGVTVSVLAAFLGVIRGLFPNGEKK